MRAERPDARWSAETETQLRRAFSEAAFRGLALERAQCGSTFCLLVVRHDGEDARGEFERFATAAPGMGGEFLFRQAPDGKPETTAYFIRADHDTPEHPVRRPL